MDPQNAAAVAANLIDIAPTVSDGRIVLAVLRATPGLTDRLERGIHVADIGCGAGASTMTMAAAFPRSRFLGIDADRASLDDARQVRAARGLRNVYWLAAAAHQLAPRPTHDLICAFDGLQGVRDPRDALRAIRAALADHGVYLWSEPDGDAGQLWQLASEAGFTRVDALQVDAGHRCLALRP